MRKKKIGIIFLCIGLGLALMGFIGFGLGYEASKEQSTGSNEYRYKLDKEYKESVDEEAKTVVMFLLGGIGGSALAITGLGLLLTGSYQEKRILLNQQIGAYALTIGKKYMSTSQRYAIEFSDGNQCYWEQDGLRYQGHYIQKAYNQWEAWIDGSQNVLQITIINYRLLIKSNGFSEYFI